MWKFAMGFLASYMTMTKKGKQLSNQIIANVKKDVNSYLEKEGIIEQAEPLRPTEPIQPDNRDKEQSSPNETVDK